MDFDNCCNLAQPLKGIYPHNREQTGPHMAHTVARYMTWSTGNLTHHPGPTHHPTRSTGDRNGALIPTYTSTGDELGSYTSPIRETADAQSPSQDRAIPSFMCAIQYPHPDSAGEPLHMSHWDVDEAVVFETPGASVAGSPAQDGPPDPPFVYWPFPTTMLPVEAARLYDVTRSANKVNHEGPKQYIPTDLVINQWDAVATGHLDENWILDAIRYGFPIQYSGPARLGMATEYNHSSAINHSEVIREFIRKETTMGALYGPFDSPPFILWIAISPLMTRQKPYSTEKRVIVDLSYPDGVINAYIYPHIFNRRKAIHALPTVDHAVLAIAEICPHSVGLIDNFLSHTLTGPS